MTTVHFSTSVYAGFVNLASVLCLFANGDNGPTNGFISGGTYAGNTALLIYKGTIANFSTFTNTTTRSSDLLINMPLAGGTNSYVDLGIITATNSRRFLCGRSSTPGGTATASGIASWFLLYNTVSSVTDLTVGAALIGSIGLPGSGADMEIVDTNIISGNPYKCLGFYLNFPFDMTF